LNKAGGFMLLTADHGNIELMKDPETGEPFTAHTTFDVPIVLYCVPNGTKIENGRLADIAPTLLALMGIEKPAVMTGHSLLTGIAAQKENA
jgi:2,3-bisphosphoglycerate-independent phosphoglycerate mutase